MPPISPAHERLGAALRACRVAAGISTRRVVRSHPDFEFFSSGHVSLVENGRTTPSPELIEAYASFAADRGILLALYEQMLAESQQISRRKRGASSDGPRPPTDPARVAARRDVQEHYVVQSNEAEYIFGDAGELQRVRCSVVLRALRPGVSIYYAGHSYGADQRRGVLSVGQVAGGKLVDNRESDSGALQSYFQLDQSLLPSDPEPYRLSFELLVRTDKTCIPRLRYFAANGNQRMVLAASFTERMFPTSIWRFGTPDHIDSEFADSGTTVSADASSRYDHVFEGLVPGWCYGFGWTWPKG